MLGIQKLGDRLNAMVFYITSKIKSTVIILYSTNIDDLCGVSLVTSSMKRVSCKTRQIFRRSNRDIITQLYYGFSGHRFYTTSNSLNWYMKGVSAVTSINITESTDLQPCVGPEHGVLLPSGYHLDYEKALGSGYVGSYSQYKEEQQQEWLKLQDTPQLPRGLNWYMKGISESALSEPVLEISTVEKVHNKDKIHQGKCFAVTVPYYTKEFDDLCEWFFAREKHLYGITVAYEKHKSGEAHIHMLLEFKNRMMVRCSRWEDLFGNKFTDVSVVRSIKKWKYYLSKEGAYFERTRELESSKPDSFIKLYNSKVLQLGSNEAALQYFRKRYVKLDTKSQEQFIRFYGVHKLNTDEKKSVEELDMYSRGRFIGFKDLHSHRNDPNYEFLSTLESRMVNSPHLAFRTPQIYVHGETGLGKTLLMNTIMEYVAHYRYPENGWHKDYYSNVYQVVFYDECDFGTKEIKRLLLDFVQGGPNVKLNVKGSHTFKQDNAFMYCASNISLSHNYYGEKYRAIGGIPPCIVSGPCGRDTLHCVNESGTGSNKECQYSYKYAPFKAFGDRFEQFYIEYPLHGFRDLPAKSTWLSYRRLEKEVLEKKYSNHRVVNWCSLDNMLFSEAALPQDYNEMYIKMKENGCNDSYTQYKKKQQKDWLASVCSVKSLDDSIKIE